MKLDWKPTNPVFLDFETMSTDQLEGGAKKYAEEPTTRVACAVLRVDGKDLVWKHDGSATMRIGKDEQPLPVPAVELYAKMTEGRTIVAHNAPFDHAIWSRFVGADRSWFDTLPVSRASGFPGKLDQLGTIFQGRGKDPTGKRLIDMISKVKVSAGRPQYFAGPEHVWRMFEDYCQRDVDLLVDVYNGTKDNVEPATMTVDRTINDRGIPVMRGMLELLNMLFEYNRIEAGEKFSGLTDGINPRSPVQIKKYLESCGFNLTTINKEDVLDLFNHPEKYCSEDYGESIDGIREVMQLREELVRSGSSKVITALRLENGGRIRDQFVYWGAHTGRWSGRALQPQNLPGMPDDIDVHELLTGGPLSYDRIVEMAQKSTEKMREGNAKNANRPVGSVLNALFRTSVRVPGASLSVIDYGAIEARGVAWIADERQMLGTFADPSQDLYRNYAGIMYGREVAKDSFERFTAKHIILGCGYGLSGPGFRKRFNVFLRSHIGKQEVHDINDEDSARFIKTYRDTYPNIVKLWRNLGDAAKDAVRNGKSTVAGKCTWYMDGAHLACVLPSGRKLWYRDAHFEMLTPRWAIHQGRPDYKQPTIVFSHPHGYQGFLYGSRICENIVQAICRDILAEALVNVESEGLCPFAHVHDEIVCQTDKLERMSEIMSVAPSWAPGFPVLVEGYCAPYWTKQSKRFKQAKYLDGRPA